MVADMHDPFKAKHPQNLQDGKDKNDLTLLQGGPHLLSRQKVNDRNLGEMTVDHICLQPQKAVNAEGFVLGHHRNAPKIREIKTFGAIDQFELGGDGIDSRNQARLRETAVQINALLRSDPSVVVNLGGHTDAVGDAISNEQLSRQRALKTREALLPLLDPGVRDRVLATTQGFGERDPIEDKEVSGRNRRVELTAVADYRERYATVLHVPGDAYGALQKDAMILDLGKGPHTKKIYGETSFEEPRTTLVLERPKAGVLADGPIKLSVVVEDPENFRVLLRGQNASSIPTTRPTKEGVALYVGEAHVADVALQSPLGKASSKNLVVGIVDDQGEVTLSRGKNLDGALHKATDLVKDHKGVKAGGASYVAAQGQKKSTEIAAGF